MSARSTFKRFPRPDPKKPRPVRMDWLEASTTIEGKAVHLAIGLWLLAVSTKSPRFSLTRRTMARVNVSRYAAYDCLRRLKEAGLITVWQLPGYSPMITLLEPGTDRPMDVAFLNQQ